jgi:RimJ/RimL family protein N-acetyltransferase
MKLDSWKKLLHWPRTKQAPTQNVRLEGNLVVLRTKVPGDAPLDYSWRADPELAALDATAPINLTLDEYVTLYRDDLSYPSPSSMRLAIDTLDGRHIGNCMCYDIDTARKQGELGIVIGHRSFWGRGYGTDAVITVLNHLFSQTELKRVYLHTLVDNKRAQRAFEKAGFKPVRPVSRDGYDFILMEAHRAEWLAERARRTDRTETTAIQPPGPSSPS